MKTDPIKSEPLFQESIEQRVCSTLISYQELIKKYFHETVEVQTVHFYLEVAKATKSPDIGEIARKLSLSKAGASRNYYRLSKGLRGAEGLDLIESFDDPMDYRRKLLRLTAKGEAVRTVLTSFTLNSISKILDGMDQVD